MREFPVPPVLYLADIDSYISSPALDTTKELELHARPFTVHQCQRHDTKP